ncbi:MAG: calcium-binding protein [Candidatus Rokuibacteriota bacterium]
MRRKPAFVAALLAVLLPAVPSFADVRAEFALGILTVNGDNDGNQIVVECVNGNVRVNDAAPSGSRVRCSNVGSILVRAGDGADVVALSDVTRQAFDILLEIGIFGETGNDTLTGSTLADRIEGGGGADVLRGGDGADRLFPGGGGGALVGGKGKDRATVSGDGDWTVDDQQIARLSPMSEQTTLQGVEVVTVNGGNGNNSLSGSAFSGSLTLDGAGGDDVLRGGSRGDQLLGKAGNDALFAGAGNDILEGGNGKDELHGGDGNDQLSGGSGDDSCEGGQGADSELSC